jgi:hypothetical protein
MSFLFELGNRGFVRHRAAVTTVAMLMLGGGAVGAAYAAVAAGRWAFGGARPAAGEEQTKQH